LKTVLNRINSFFKDWKYRLPLIIQLLLLGSTVIFVSFLFPNQAQFKYQYGLGKIWKYEDLYAPYDFAIRKSSQEINRSEERVKQDFIPYYNKDTSTFNSSLSFIRAQFNVLSMSIDSQSIQDLKNLTELEAIVEKKLIELYEIGIISNASEIPDSDSLPLVNLLENGKISVYRTEKFIPLKNVRAEMVSLVDNSSISSTFPELRNIVEQSIDPNVYYDQELSKKFLEQELQSISQALGKISKGELIIRKGNTINRDVIQILTSLEERYIDDLEGESSYWQIYLGHLLFSLLIISLFYLFLNFRYPYILASFKKLVFFLVWFWLFAYMVYAVEANPSLSVYMLPFCIVPIVIKNFFDGNLAFITLILLVLLTSFISSPGLDFAFIMILGGLVAILIETETRYWARYFYSISLIVIALFIGYLSISVIKEGTVSGINWGNYNWLLINGVLILLSYPLIPLLERIFGFTSSITLAELSDLNKPLLKKLSIKAPGTFQHSIQVANLAEAAATKIGANSLLVKVGALYHDIGKMNNPGYFIENNLDQTLMHEKLDCKESARIIIAHVQDGVNIARNINLPLMIIDFIKTHHGTTKVEYFYRKHIESCAEGNESEESFVYPGPRPRTKEQTILMLADSVEAASRSQTFSDEASIENFVDQIIAYKVKEKQLEHSELSFEELETCRRVFKKMLKSIYNSRIRYPKHLQTVNMDAIEEEEE